MSIEGIVLKKISAVPKTDINSTTKSRQRHAVFHSYYCTQQTFDFISQKEKLMTTSFSIIWVNTDGCAEQYICASSLYLMSVMS